MELESFSFTCLMARDKLVTSTTLMAKVMFTSSRAVGTTNKIGAAVTF